MKKSIIAVCVLASFLLAGCVLNADARTIVWRVTKRVDFAGSASRVVDVEPFRGVSSHVPFQVTYEQSDVPSVTLMGDEKIFDKVIFKVTRDGILDISLARGRYVNVRLKVRVCGPDVRVLEQHGSGDLDCLTDIVTDEDLSLAVNGSGEVNVLGVQCNTLSASVSGSGDIETGSVQCVDAVARVSGSGSFDADAVRCTEMSLSVSGSGDAGVDHAEVTGALRATVSGSGDVEVDGRAGKAYASVSGSGSIEGDLHYTSIEKKRSGSGQIRW